MAMLSELGQTRWGRQAQDFWRWWTAELIGMAPTSLIERLQTGSGRLLIDIGEQTVTFGHWRHGRWRRLNAFARGAATDAEMSRAAADYMREFGIAPGEAVVRLPAAQALRKQLDMPMAAEASLRSILTHQVDRQTPFKAEQVYFDCRVRARDPQNNQIRVEWVLMARPAVDGALALAKRWGVDPAAVDIVGQDAGEVAGINLRPQVAAREQSPLRRQAGYGLAGLAAALLVTALALPFHLRGVQMEKLRVQMAQLKVEADAATNLRKEIERVSEDSRFLGNKKKQAPSMLRTMNELTRVLPDGSWLIELFASDAEVRITGFAQSASSLIAQIEESPLFQKTVFRSPVTQSPRGETERFNLAFEFESEERK
jgi:general secretion pathway protein L